MDNPEISIIIPIYNKEKFLSRCINSILNQTFKNFECILIDDGSTDNSKSICIDYANKDPRIKYYYQENSGPASARYNGIIKSTAEMIMFVDADDWISNNTVEIFYSEYKKTNADIVFNTVINTVLDDISSERKSKLMDDELTALIYYLHPSVEKGNCNKLINKKLLQNLFIPEKSVYEDFVTGVQVFSNIEKEKIAIISIPNIYYYCKYSDGNTLSYRAKDFFNKPFNEINGIRVFYWIENYISLLKISNKEALKAAYSLFFINTIILPYLIQSSFVEKSETKFFLNYYKNAILTGEISFLRRLYINLFCNFYIVGKFSQKIVINLRTIKYMFKN